MTGFRLLNWTSSSDILENLDTVARELGGHDYFRRERGEKAYHLSLDIPGVKKENVALEARERRLLVTVRDRFDEEKRYSEWLPEDADAEAAEARLEDGVLYLKIPFKKDGGGVKIDIL